MATWKAHIIKEDDSRRLYGHLIAVNNDHMWSLGDRLIEYSFAFPLASNGKLFDLNVSLALCVMLL